MESATGKKDPIGIHYGQGSQQSDSSKAVVDIEESPVTEFGTIERALKSRHVQLIALGGCIGTGLFVGSGTILKNSGPASLLIVYIIMSFVIWTIMNVLGEMTTFMPLQGSSAPYFVDRYADKSLGFAAGWNYWYAYSFLVPSEITAAGLVIDYWTDSVNIAVWITIILVVIVLLNIIVVQFFGETEFWFASIKIITILGLLILGVVLFFGGGPKHDRLGFRFWEHGMAFQPYLVEGNAGKFCGFWNALVRSGFSFILSPELITITAGETEAPRRNIPKATSRFIYRLLFFYVFGALVIGVIVSSRDPTLLEAIKNGKSGAAASPFVIGIENAGIPVLNHIVNAAILTSAWSSANSFLYAGSRTLYSLAMDGQAPRIFKHCNRWGVPYYAVAATALVACLAYLNVSSSSANVFTWFTNLSTISGFIAWLCVLVAYLRWRSALQLHNAMDIRPFKTILQPYASYVVLFIVGLITITNGFNVFVGGSFTGGDFVAAYITLPIFGILWLGHKFWTKNHRWLIPVPDIDVFGGLAQVEEEESSYPDRSPKNTIEKVWQWVA